MDGHPHEDATALTGPRGANDLVSDPALAGYHLLPAVRGDLLHKLDRMDEDRTAIEKAASLTRSGRQLTLLLDRVAACIVAT